jgi:hypothetical protein
MCPYHSPAMRFVRSGSCASRRPLVSFSLALIGVWSAPEAHNCASASYRIKCLPVVTGSRPGTVITATEWARVEWLCLPPLSLLPVVSPVIHLSYAAVCPTCQSRRHIAGARVGEVILSPELSSVFCPCTFLFVVSVSRPLLDVPWRGRAGVCQV